jgi:hypothetical protein
MRSPALVASWLRLCVLSFALATGCADRDARPETPPDAAIDFDAGNADDGGEPDASQAPTRDGGPRRDGGLPRPVDGGARDGGFTLPPEVIVIEVRSFEPRRGPVSGGTPILITGRGFVPGTTVTIGGRALEGVAIQSERTITGRTPSGAAGAAAVLIENRAGRFEIPGGFVYEEPPRVDSIFPTQGATGGGTQVTVTGDGFTPESALFIGARPAFAVAVASRSRITAITPPGTLGSASVSVVHRGGVSIREDAFTYVAEPSISSVAPPYGPAAGGNEVIVRGGGFDASARVFFGGVPAATTLRNATELSVIAPPAGAAGPVDVAVRSDGGGAHLARAYTYVAPGGPLTLLGLSPPRGPETGGTSVLIVGGGFERGVNDVHFGPALAAGLVVESANAVRVVTPAGSAGAVDVRLRASDSSEVVLPRAFVFESALRVDSLSPARGPSAGGTEVVVRGDGFSAATGVFFGPVAAAGVTFVDAQTLLVRTPAGPGGPVDVAVHTGDRAATLPSGFYFDEPPRVFRVTPERGAIAGGTFVRIAGAGFTPDSRIFIGGTEARDVRYVHAGLVTARTPPGFVGPADVLGGNPGAPGALLEGGYSYFDPATRFSGTSGGPNLGAVNVTVLNGTNGRPVPGAFATLAIDGPTLYEGVTNANGQVVLSGPDLGGRQTITVTKDLWSSYSVVQFDAQNVTLYISPLTGSFGPGQPGPEPPTIKGTLRSAFKPIPPAPPGFRAAILVTTSAEAYWLADSVGQGALQVLYDDGREDRAYEITGRFGDQAVYALGGHLKDDGTQFIPYVLGLRRNITIQPTERVVDNKDVRIDADLPATLDARLLSAPPLRAEGPHVYRMRVYLDLGAEGVLWFFQLPESTREPRLIQAHLPVIGGAVAGARFFVVAGAYTLQSGYETLPLSENVVERITDLREPIDIGPMMGIATAARPIEGEVLGDHRFGWRIDTPPDASYFQLYLPQQVGSFVSTVWTVIVPGHLREAVMPDLATVLGIGGLPSASTVDWYVVSSRVRRFDIDAYDSRDLRDRLGYSFVRHTFETP